MNGHYTYTPYIWSSFFTVILLIALSIYSGRRRNVPGALPFMIGCLFAALWAAGSVMEYAAVDVETKIFWVKFQGVWHLPVATIILCFVLEYAWPGRWLTRRNLTLLSIPPLLILGLVVTNNLHHLVWRSFEFDGSVLPRLGPGGWILLSYAYGLVIANLVILVWLFPRSQYHRWPVVVMLMGQFGGRGIYLLEKFYILHSDLPLNTLGMGFEFLMYVIALFGFRIFDPIPMARQTVITQMRDGMLALDAQGRVVSLNPAAELFLGATAKQIMGKPARELLPAYPDGYLTDLSGTEIEFSRKTGQELRHYTLAVSLLRDWRELEIGRLLLLRDVTGQKRAQAEILEQQRALATLRERDRLARELHDELAQGLSLINLQAQLVCGLMDADQMEQAKEQLQVLARAARDAQVDVRGEISKLAHGILSEEGFAPALQHITENFQQANGIPTELVLPRDDVIFAIAPTVEVQLLRIVQEAFANIRKHAQAKHVQVTLQKTGSCLRLIIEDDGVGFDRDSLPASRKSFGLDIMHERAAETNGRVEIQSAVGRGTMVQVEVPLGKP